MYNKYFKECQNCTRPEKKPGCHDHCKFYKDEKAAYEKAKKQERKRRKLEAALWEAEKKRTDKATRYYEMRK